MDGVIMAAAILLFLCALGADVYTDYERWKKSKRVNHRIGTIYRIVLLIPSFFLFTAGADRFIIQSLAVLMMQFSWFWFLFDGIYNKLRGFKWWFRGSVDKDDAKLDKLPLWISIPAKGAGIVCGTIWYITEVMQ